MSREKLLLSELPPEMLDNILHYLSAEDSLALCFSSGNIFNKTLLGKEVFKSVFRKCWMGNDAYDEAKHIFLMVQKQWKKKSFPKNYNSSFLSALEKYCVSSKKRRLMSLKCDQYKIGRICVDLSLICKTHMTEDNHDKDFNTIPNVLPNTTVQDVTYYLADGKTPVKTSPLCKHSCSSKEPLALKNISNSVITYAISRTHIALVLSNNHTVPGVMVSVWSLTCSSAKHLYITTEDHPLWIQEATINEEDILAHNNFLFTLPFCVGQAPLLQVFDMDEDGVPLVGSFCLEAGLYRTGPLIEKEGSATRLHIYQDRLVVIVPLPFWTIYILDISPLLCPDYFHGPLSGVTTINCVFRRKLGNIQPASVQPFTFYASDQTDSILLLGFAETSNKNLTGSCAQCFVTLDLRSFASSETSKKIFTYTVSDWGDYSPDVPMIPSLTEEQEELNSGFANECFLATSRILHKFAILTHQGAVLMMDGSNSLDSDRQVTKLDLMEKCMDIVNVPGKMNPQDTFYDQLELSGQDNLLALKVITPHKLLFSFTFSGIILWSADLSLPTFNMNPSQRIFISCIDPAVMVTTPTNTIVLSAESGQLVTSLLIPHYTRKTEEPPRDSYYGYAACAYGAWELVRTANRIVHVHDMERNHPVLMDVIFLK